MSFPYAKRPGRTWQNGCIWRQSLQLLGEKKQSWRRNLCWLILDIWSYMNLPTVITKIWTSNSNPRGKLMRHSRFQGSCCPVLLLNNNFTLTKAVWCASSDRVEEKASYSCCRRYINAILITVRIITLFMLILLLYYYGITVIILYQASLQHILWKRTQKGSFKCWEKTLSVL